MPLKSATPFQVLAVAPNCAWDSGWQSTKTKGRRDSGDWLVVAARVGSGEFGSERSQQPRGRVQSRHAVVVRQAFIQSRPPWMVPDQRKPRSNSRRKQPMSPRETNHKMPVRWTESSGRRVGRGHGRCFGAQLGLSPRK